MTALKFGILSPESRKRRLLDIRLGRLIPHPDEPKIWFDSTEEFAKILSNRNMALLATIAAVKPQSAEDLAILTRQDRQTLVNTLKTLERYGLLRLNRKGERGRIRPELLHATLLLELRLLPDQPD